MNFLILSLFLSVIYCTSTGYGQYTDGKVVENYLKSLRDKNYDKRTAPGVNNGFPVHVGVSSYILDIHKVDDLNMDLNADLYFRQSWYDSRLAYTYAVDTIILRDEDVIWTPDLFFIEEREGSIHQVMHPNKFIHIRPNGDVLYSAKVSVRFNCRMDLRNYPHDTQKCTLHAESYGHKKSQISLHWNSSSGHNPLTASEDITMLDFALTEVKPSSRNISMSFGEYSSLQIKLTFRRKFGFFATRLYVPFIILVLMASFSFYIRAEERFMRLSLLLVILYLMVTISSEVNNLTPPAPYTKASDVWIGFCESLVFAAFLEFIAVALIAGTDNESSSCKGEILPTLDPDAKEHNLSTDSLKSPVAKLINMLDARNGGQGKRNPMSYRIDRICRIVFPFIFLLFNVVYWSVYATI